MSLFYSCQHELFEATDKELLYKYGEGILDFSSSEWERLVVLCGLAEEMARRQLDGFCGIDAFTVESKDRQTIEYWWEENAY